MIGDYLSGATVIVVGGGVVGACITYRIAQAGAETVLVTERDRRGSGTWGSFAWLNAYGKYPREYFRLNMDSIREHAELCAELGGAWLTLKGGLHVEFADDAVDRRESESIARQMQGWGGRIDEVSPADVRAMEPDLDLSGASRIFLVAREGFVYPVPLAHRAVQEAHLRYRARLVYGSVRRLAHDAGSVTGVVLENGELLSGDLVIVAAGARTAQFMSEADEGDLVEASPGAVLTTSVQDVCLERPVVTSRLSIRPAGGGCLVIGCDATSGASEVPGVDLGSDGVRAAVRLAEGILPGAGPIRLEGVRYGTRPIPRDGYPIIGPSSKVSGLYYAVSHSGVTLGPAMANLVVDDLHGGSLGQLDPYRPERFANGVAGATGPSAE